MKCCLNPVSLFARPSEEGASNNPSEGSLGFLGTAACTNGWNMNLGPVARNREVVSQKNCSQLYSSHRTLYFSQLLDDWSNPCDVFVWTVFSSSQKCSYNTIRSIVSWRIKLLVAAVVGCGRELGKAVSESRVSKPSPHICWGINVQSVWCLIWWVSPSLSRPDHTNFPNWNIMSPGGGGGPGPAPCHGCIGPPASDIMTWHQARLGHETKVTSTRRETHASISLYPYSIQSCISVS